MRTAAGEGSAGRVRAGRRQRRADRRGRRCRPGCAVDWQRQARTAERPRPTRNGLFRLPRSRRTAVACCSWPATRTSSWPAGNDYNIYQHDPDAEPVRADGLLHRPLAVPARPDDPVQGHLHLRVDQEADNYKVLAGAGADGGLPRPQQQGDRPAAAPQPTTTGRSAAASRRRATG